MNNKRRAEIASLLTQIGNVKAAIEEAQGQFADILSALEDVANEEHESFDTLLEKAQESNYGCAIHDAAGHLDTALSTIVEINVISQGVPPDLDDVINVLKLAAK